MTYRLTAPSRLHFGLLGWGAEAPRQFGSVGLMVKGPGLVIEARPSPDWGAGGPLSDRVRSVAERVVRTLNEEQVEVSPLQFRVVEAPPEHVGLGTGTQLSLAVARLILASLGSEEPDLSRLVDLTGRGRRSGIGVHGFMRGGLIVDGGHSPRSSIPPLIARLPFPADWNVLIVIPSEGLGMSGRRESEAFAGLPEPSSRTTDRLCRLVLLELLPALVERNLPEFGSALSRIQDEVGACFAPAQGGRFAGPTLEATAALMTELGLVGVGQSSWGPTLYGFTEVDPSIRTRMTDALQMRLGADQALLLWTQAAGGAAIVDRLRSGTP